MSGHVFKKFEAYLFLLPAIALLVVFKLYPVFSAIFLSFNKVSFMSGERVWNGFGNYIELVTYKNFWHAFRNTLVFCVAVPVAHIGVSLCMALLAIRHQPGAKFFRLVCFLPIVMSNVVMAVIWQLMLAGERHGLINSFLSLLKISPQPFLTSPKQALASIMLIPIWGGAGYWMMIMIAGLQAIPRSLYESAQIDGAGPIRQFLSITIPLLRRTITYIVVSDTILSFLYFAPIYIITKGGPSNSTTLLAYETYRAAFVFWDLGNAAAYATMLLLLILVIVLIQLKYLTARFTY